MALLNKEDVTELPYARHNITSDDIDAVVQVLSSKVVQMHLFIRYLILIMLMNQKVLMDGQMKQL